MNERWILHPLPNGRISTVPRWPSPESDETPEVFSRKVCRLKLQRSLNSRLRYNTAG